MGLTLRSSLPLGTPLTWTQGDNNWLYLLTTMSGSLLTLVGDTVLTGSLTISGGIGRVYGTASYALNADSASYVLSSSYAATATSASYALSASWAPSTGGTANPGGSDKQIQINSGSSFLGTGSFTFDYTKQSLTNGLSVLASGIYSHAEGRNTLASGNYSHAEGNTTIAISSDSHAEGLNTLAIGIASHAEGNASTASGVSSHAEGYNNIASGNGAHAEGLNTLASGLYSHTEGYLTIASGLYSHAEGLGSIAVGAASKAGGTYTVASGSAQVVYGTHNTLNNTTSLFVIGGGSGLSKKDIFDARVDNYLSGSIKLPTNSGNPNNPLTGSMYFNPSTNLLYIYNGTAWRSASFS